MLAFIEQRTSPLTRRRWANFRANQRGFWSLRIFLCLLLLSLCAEFIANDKPLILGYNWAVYVPVLFVHYETEFGGVFEVEAEYRDAAVESLIVAGEGWMLWPPIPYSYDTIDMNIPSAAPSPPSPRHWLGTDDIGRDVLARIIYGFRLSVLFGMVLTLFSALIGISVGAVQGYFGGWVDLIGQRLVEIRGGLPVLFLLIILSSLVRPSVFTLQGLLMLFQWMALVGVVRAEFLRTRNFDYVRASRALGASNFTIMRQDVLPNAMVATLTFLPFLLNGAITVLTSLDILGFGVTGRVALPGGIAGPGEEQSGCAMAGTSGLFHPVDHAEPAHLHW